MLTSRTAPARRIALTLFVAALASLSLPQASAWRPDDHVEMTRVAATEANERLGGSLSGMDISGTPSKLPVPTRTCLDKKIAKDKDVHNGGGNPIELLAENTRVPDSPEVDPFLGSHLADQVTLVRWWKKATGGCAVTVGDTQQWRHTWFVDPTGNVHLVWGNAPEQVEHYYGKARDAFKNGQNGTGLFYLSLAAHYVEDMGVPYHTGYEPLSNGVLGGLEIYFDYLEKCNLSVVCSGHNRYERDIGYNVWADASRIDLDGLPIPDYEEPGDYARFLAFSTRPLGPAITSGYALVDFTAPGSLEHAAGEVLLEETSELLLQESARHAAGLILHMFEELPELRAGTPSVSGGRVTVPVTNSGRIDANNVLVRLLRSGCNGTFACNAGTEVVADVLASIPAGATRVVEFAAPPSLNGHRLLVMLDAVPLDGSACGIGGAYGCLLERDEATGAMRAAPQVVAAPLPDLSVAPEDIQVLPGRAAVVVRNPGAADAGAFEVRLYRRDPATGQPALAGTQAVSGVPAGAALPVTVAYSGSLPDPIVRIDEPAQVAEVDEVGNNQAAITTWTIAASETRTGTQRPLGDVTVASGATLTLTSGSLLMAPGASLTVEPGGAIDLQDSTLAAAKDGEGYLATVHGDLRLSTSTVSGALGGLRFDGPSATITHSTFRSLAGGPALALESGDAVLHDNLFTGGLGDGLLVSGDAVARLADDRFTGNAGKAIDARGGHLALDGVVVQGSPTALALSGGASVHASGARLQPGVGLAPGASAVAVLNSGGVLEGDDVRIDNASTALRGTRGSVDLRGGWVRGTQLVDGTGAFVAKAAWAPVAGSRAVSGGARFQVDWPLLLQVNGPEGLGVPDASVTIRDATGAVAWQGLTDELGGVRVELPQYRHAGPTLHALSPYTVEARANGPSVTQSVSLDAPRTLTLLPPVLPDLIVIDVQPVYSGGQALLQATVANAEPGPAAGAPLRFAVDGVTAGTVQVPALPGFSVVNVTLPLPAGVGVRSMSAVADPDGALTESDDANNAMARQAWVVAGDEPCVGGARTLAGVLLVLPGGRLDAACTVRLGGDVNVPSYAVVLDGGELAVGPLGRIEAANASVRYTLAVAGGTLRVAGGSVSGGAIVAEDATVVLDGATLDGPVGTLLLAEGGSVTVTGSTVRGGPLGRGLHMLYAATSVTGSTFSGFGEAGLTLEHVPVATLRHNTFTGLGTGIALIDASVTVEDSVVDPSVAQSFQVLGSRPTLLNVTHDLQSIWLDPPSRLRTAWHAFARIRGVDGEPVRDTVTVIDRAGRWVGQFDTAANGDTADLRLTESIVRDIDGDGRPALPAEVERLEPYGLQAGERSAALAVTGNVVATLAQTYKARLSTAFPFLQTPASQPVDFPVTARNLGNGNDTMAFALSGATPGWTATLSAASATLGPGGQAALTVRMTPPPGENQTGSVDVTATSEDGTAGPALRLVAKTAPNVPPAAAFNLVPAVVYRGEPVTAQDLSTDADGWIASWAWDFGDGATSTDAVPQHAYSTPGAHTVTLTVRDNAGAAATATRVLTVADRAPSLLDGRVTPALVRSGEPATFEVTYRDPDGDLPSQVRVLVDGVPHVMAAGAGNALTGISYSWTATSLPRGQHAFRFEAVPAQGAYVLHPANFDASGPRVADPPRLESPTVSPAAGTAETLFTYRVVYRDADDDAPSRLEAVLADGRVLPMVPETLGSPDYAAGVAYVAHATLPPGTPAHRFRSGDGAFAVETEDLAGPAVTGTPVLGSPSATPAVGRPGDAFTFAVTYRSADGIGPDAVRVLVDGQVHNLVAVSGTPDGPDGQRFAKAIALAGSAAHPYAVEVVKSGQATRLPATGQLDGPVTNTLPTPSSTLGTDGTIATVFVADARGSTDAETAANRLETRMDWGDGQATAWSKVRQHEHRYRAPGVYQTTLWVRDGAGESATLTRTVNVADQAPTASFAIYPGVGNAAQGAGPATTFTFAAGDSGDLETAWDALMTRWDWEGDGAWDTAWAPLASHPTHQYAFAATYEPTLEVRDSAGQSATATRTLVVEGLHRLEPLSAAEGALVAAGQDHVYRLDLPAKALGQLPDLNAEVALTSPAVAGANLDLFVQMGSPPDPAACSPPSCRMAASTASGGTERVCWRLPQAGTYYIVVRATDHPGEPVPYTLAHRANVVEARTEVARCLALG